MLLQLLHPLGVASVGSTAEFTLFNPVEPPTLLPFTPVCICLALVDQGLHVQSLRHIFDGSGWLAGEVVAYVATASPKSACPSRTRQHILDFDLGCGGGWVKGGSVGGG